MCKNKLAALLELIAIMFLALIGAAPVDAMTPVPIGKAGAPPVIDGKLNDAIWAEATVFTDFKTMDPDFGLKPSENTRVYVAYDASAMYFAVKSLDREAGKIKASLTRRDNMGNDDWVSIELDTFNDTQSNYLFVVNPLGIQSDGMIDANGQDDLSMDMIWSSKGQLTDDGYVVELAIPFRSLRLPYKETVVMGVGMRRSISRKSETLSFPQFDPKKGSRLTQRRSIAISGIKYRRAMEVMPVVSVNNSSHFNGSQWQTQNRNKDIGLTAKMSLTPTLTLDATYNPDFSHVEGDAGQVDVNLRSALYFSEKRSFFLEGKENFNFAASYSPLRRVVNTRSIVDPLIGLKLNGKIGSRDLVSAIFALDEQPRKLAQADGEDGGKNAVVTIMRYKRSLNQDSYVGAFFTGRGEGDDYNGVLGIDGRLRLSGKNRIEFHAFGSANRDKTSGLTHGSAAAFEFWRYSRRFGLVTGVKNYSGGFHTETGHLLRTGITELPFEFRFSFFPKSKLVPRINWRVVTRQTLDHASRLWETYNYTGLEVYFPRKTWIWFGGNLQSEVFLGRRFNRNDFGGGLYSQILKQLYFSVEFNHGNKVYYDPESPYPGKGSSIDVTMTFQPTEKLSTGLEAAYSDFYRKPGGEKVYDYTILRNRTSFQFNKYLYLRGIVEYNAYHKRIQGDVLASFTYIPGTVIQAGYGSVYENINQDHAPASTVPGTYRHVRKSFFFKASYLYRF